MSLYIREDKFIVLGKPVNLLFHRRILKQVQRTVCHWICQYALWRQKGTVLCWDTWGRPNQPARRCAFSIKKKKKKVWILAKLDWPLIVSGHQDAFLKGDALYLWSRSHTCDLASELADDWQGSTYFRNSVIKPFCLPSYYYLAENYQGVVGLLTINYFALVLSRGSIY